jgi:hypothetical protein
MVDDGIDGPYTMIREWVPLITAACDLDPDIES